MLENEIKDIYDALAIILVFTTILANNSEKRTDDILDEYIPQGLQAKLGNQLKGINRFIFKEWIFILFINMGLGYILTPTAWKIIKNSSIDLTSFNVSMTLYMFIYVIMIYFIGSYIVLTFKLFKRRKEVKKELKKLG